MQDLYTQLSGYDKCHARSRVSTVRVQCWDGLDQCHRQPILKASCSFQAKPMFLDHRWSFGIIGVVVLEDPDGDFKD